MNPYIYIGLPSRVKLNIKTRKINIEDVSQYVTKTICDYFGFSFEAINNTCRKRELVKVRQFIMFWQCQKSKASLTTIANIFTLKGYDHSDVIYAKKTYENLLINRDWKADHEAIKELLKDI